MTTNNTALNSYLSRLDQALGPIPVSDKAEIVLEIKSHVEEALRSGGELSSTLAALGEPETVANRYLMERGLQPQRAPKHPMVKWLTIGFLGTFGIFCLTALIVLWNFTPLIRVDEKAGRVQILGGLIDINESNMASDTKGKSIQGKTAMKPGQQLDLKFSNANLEFRNSLDTDFHWSCKLGMQKGQSGEITVTDVDGIVRMDVSDVEGAKCDLELPAGTTLIASGANGKIEVEKPTFNTDIKMSNGLVDIRIDEKGKYVYDFRVTNGSAPSDLISSKDSKALRMSASVANGRITVE